MRNGMIHHGFAVSLPVISRIKEHSSHLVVDKGNKANGFPADLRYPSIGECEVNIPHCIGLTVKKLLGQERMSHFACCAPDRNDGIRIDVFVFSDHLQRCLSLCSQRS